MVYLLMITFIGTFRFLSAIGFLVESSEMIVLIRFFCFLDLSTKCDLLFPKLTDNFHPIHPILPLK